MDAHDGLAGRFEAERDGLRALAYRMLGSAAEAEDAVQEAWLRLARVDAGQVDNLAAWLRTVVTRICLDMLRSRAARREDLTGSPVLDAVPDGAPGPAPEAARPEDAAVLA
ncbi:MAG: RNA polymerase subunit sigma-70, partial [Streptomycetaceae bacterium]|nr:RNA polymerase subunit sigma-70 [Streptomycetaceae bacterium]